MEFLLLPICDSYILPLLTVITALTNFSEKVLCVCVLYVSFSWQFTDHYETRTLAGGTFQSDPELKIEKKDLLKKWLSTYKVYVLLLSNEV